MSVDIPKEEVKRDDEMTIVIGKPPIWEEAHKHFKIDDMKTVYTYGDKLYNPAGLTIEDHLMAHESTHADQQLSLEGGPAEWWKQHFADPKFRLTQELEAYQNQYIFFCSRHGDRNTRARFLHVIAGDLSSGMYQIGLSYVDASRLIKGNTR